MNTLQRKLRGVTIDLGGVAILAALSLAIGLGLNRARTPPLPLRYQAPELQLQAATDRLATRGAPSDDTPAGTSIPADMGLEEFHAFVTERKGLVIDARPAGFYAEGHVPGALNVAREAFEGDYVRQGSKLTAARGQEIVIYCAGGDCRDSTLVADALAKLGYPRLRIYRAGWDEWSQTGLPQEKGRDR